MSWYNNTSTEFIDGTQQFTGGSTNISNGGGDVSGTPSGDITDLIQLVNNDTFVKNIYTDGRIYFYVANAVNDSGFNYNTRINNDGNLQYYHSFTLLVPTKLSGFYNVGDAITGLEQGAVITGAIVATIQGEVTLIQSDLITLNTDYFAFKTTTITQIADIYNLLYNLWTNDKGLAGWKKQPDTGEIFDELWDLFGGQVDRGTNLGGSFALPKMLRLKGSKLAFLSTFINRFNNALIYAGIGVAIYGIYKILDIQDRESQEEDLLQIQRMRLDVEDNVANGDTSSQQVSHIYIDYLTIDQTTNNGFTTAGIYESISIQKGAELAIEIKDVSGTLQAEIVSVMAIGSGFSVNEEIFINKSEIGGTTGQLRIVVSQLASFAYILEQDEIKTSTRLEQVDNRIRRRQYIPNKDDFSTDGFNVIQTFTTEPTGESLSQIAISLKVDTSQFSYDATGNLQINNYGTIPVNTSQFQYVGGNLELINYSQIATNSTDIGNNASAISTLQSDLVTANNNISTNASAISGLTTKANTNSADISTINGQISGINFNLGVTNGNVTANANAITNLQTDITNLNTDKTEIYQLILNDGETPSTTTTKQVNIGFNKSEFNNIIFPLIMGAVKLTSTQEIAFNITDFNSFYWGTYPDMTRLNYNPTITLVKQDNSYYYNDNNWNNGGLVERGAYYFKNEQIGFVYDLNRRFEYLGFHRFKTNISGQNTYVIRTALEFEEVVGVPSYQPEPNKLQFYLRDGKFYFSHLCRYDLTYYAIRFNQNILNDFINPIATFSSTISPTGNNRGTLNINITTAPFNEDYYLRIDDSLEGITRTQMENLFDTNTHSNERFCGMVQNFQGQAGSVPHKSFGDIVLFQSSYTTNYRIARIELEYMFKQRDGTNGFWILNNPTSQTALNNIKEELVFEFYNSYTDTAPADVVPVNNLVTFNTSTNTITLNFDKSPDTQTYLYEKWKLKARFISGFSGYTNQGNIGYNYVPFQTSAFIVKMKLFPYIQKTITREKVEEFSDNTIHSLSAFDYNKINLHINLNNNILPFNDIWYKLNDNLDANKYQITIPQSFNTSQLSDLTDLPPNVSSLPTDNFDFLNDDFFVSSGQQTITELNDILIIGDEDIGITQYETHFGWRYLLPIDNDMSETDLDNYDYLKTYNYYHRTAICDRFFSCKEFFADIIDFRNLLVDGNLAYDDMTTSEFSTLSQNSEGFSLKSLSSVNIQNLYGLTGSGFLYYDSVNGFTTQTANVTNYWTQQSGTEISYPNTISVGNVKTNTIVLTSGSPSASITFADGSSITTATGLSYSTYTDADVRAVLANSGSTNIIWNATTNQFELNSTITTDIGNNSTAITNLNNLIEDVSGDTKVKATNDIIFENNSLEKLRITQSGSIKTGTSVVNLPIDFSHMPNGWLRVNDFGHIKMRNTQTSSRWDISIRNTGILSFSSVSSGTYDNGVINSANNIMVMTQGGFMGIGTNNPSNKLDVAGYIDCFGLNFTTNINNVSITEFGYLNGVTSAIQTQFNNLDGRINANQLAIAVHSQDIININNDISTLTTRSLQNEADIATLTPIVNSVSYLPAILYNSGSITYLDTTNNNDFKLRLGTTEGLTINKSSLNVPTLNTPNALIVNTSASTANVYGLEMESRGILMKTSGSIIMDNISGVIVRGKTTATGNSIFDMNQNNSFFRLNALCMILMRNQNNANRFQIGIRNNGNLCIGNDTSTNSGTMGGANDKVRLTPSGEVEVRYNLKVGDANGALLTEISLLNLPTSAPSQANRVWRDTNGFLRIT